MARSLFLVVIGVLGGAALAWLLGRPDPASLPAGSASVPVVETAVLPPPSAALTSADGGFAAARIAIFEQVAATDDVIDLERLIRQAAGEPQSRLRELRL